MMNMDPYSKWLNLHNTYLFNCILNFFVPSVTIGKWYLNLKDKYENKPNQTMPNVGVDLRLVVNEGNVSNSVDNDGGQQDFQPDLQGIIDIRLY